MTKDLAFELSSALILAAIARHRARFFLPFFHSFSPAPPPVYVSLCRHGVYMCVCLCVYTCSLTGEKEDSRNPSGTFVRCFSLLLPFSFFLHEDCLFTRQFNHPRRRSLSMGCRVFLPRVYSVPSDSVLRMDGGSTLKIRGNSFVRGGVDNSW